MEAQLIDIKNTLKNYENTHPNLSKLWREYIDVKVKKLEQTILECENAIDLMKTRDDISVENMSTLYLFSLLNNNDLNVNF